MRRSRLNPRTTTGDYERGDARHSDWQPLQGCNTAAGQYRNLTGFPS